jgi:hypothetical protein
MLIILRNTFDVVPGEPHIGEPGGSTGPFPGRLVFELIREADAEIQGGLVFELIRESASSVNRRTILEIRRLEVVHTKGNRGTLDIRRIGLPERANPRLELEVRRLGSAGPRGRLTEDI